MPPILRRLMLSIAVMVWGGILVYFHASGRINVYLAPDFRLFALIGGLGLVVLGLFNALMCANPAFVPHDHKGDPNATEAGDMHPLAGFLLMIVPICMSVAWTKDEYSLAALSRKGLFDAPSATSLPFMSASLEPLTREDLERTHRRTSDGFFEFNLMELFFATGDREMQQVIDGLEVQTEGRWIDERQNNPDGRRRRLYRLFMTCCIADSRAIPIVLEFAGEPPEMPENGWARVAGTMSFPTENGVIQPVLLAERALAADPPIEEMFLRN
jgi:uncharacterized repeat protein (TIGR03943 family)